MSECEYIKLNTSIQTGSNATEPRTNEEGDIEAVIELRLPDDLIKRNPRKKVENVELQTTKLRLSMANLPTAQIPVDYDQSTDNTLFSTCALGVWPFCWPNNTSFQPPIAGGVLNNCAFPYWNKHELYILVKGMDATGENEEIEQDPVLNPFNVVDPGIGEYFPTLKDPSILFHNMYLSWSAKMENFPLEQMKNTKAPCQIKEIESIERILQDALENAMSWECTEAFHVAVSYWVHYPYLVDLSPPPHPEYTRVMNGATYCFWKYELFTDPQNTPPSLLRPSLNSHLAAAVKPEVRLDEQSLTISYDTAPFLGNGTIPILWNQSFINNYEIPLNLRDEPLWIHKPPPKRVCLYDVNQEETSFNYNLPEIQNAAAFNIIANKEMKNTFDFLPWMKVDRFKTNPNNTLKYYRPHFSIRYDDSTPSDDNDCFWLLDCTAANLTVTGPDPVTVDEGVMKIQTDTTVTNTQEKQESTNTVVSINVTNVEGCLGSKTGSTSYFEYTAYFHQLPDPPYVEQYPYMITNVRGIIGSDYYITNVSDKVIDNNTSRVITTLNFGEWETTSNTTESSTTYSTQYLPEDQREIGTVISETTNTQGGNVVGPEKNFDKLSDLYNDLPSASFHTSIRHITCLNPDSGDYYPFKDEYIEVLYKPTGATEPQVYSTGETTLKIPYPVYSGNYFSETTTVVDDPEHSDPNTEPEQVVKHVYRWTNYPVIITNFTVNARKSNGDYFYNTRETTTTTSISTVDSPAPSLVGNLHLTYTWPNLPVVVMSPLSSIVLTLDGLKFTQEIQPINMQLPTGSSLVQTIPVVENYYSLATTLRDLHDELVVTRSDFDSNPKYVVSPESIGARSLKISAKYIAKDGTLTQIYIPKNGVFNLQLTFRVSYFTI